MKPLWLIPGLSLSLALLARAGCAAAQETQPEGARERADTTSSVTDGARDTAETAARDAASELDSLLRADSVFVADTVMMTFSARQTRVDRAGGFTPEPIRAMWIGIAFPGGGQIYNRKFWKLPAFYGGFLGCMYALTWNNMMLRDYSQAYLDIMDDDPDTRSYEEMLPLGYDITGKEDRFKTIFKNKKDRYRKFRDLSVFSFIGVYALSIIDAYVDAELSSFDISRDLSISIEPAVMDIAMGHPAAARGEGKAYGLQMSLRF